MNNSKYINEYKFYGVSRITIPLNLMKELDIRLNDKLNIFDIKENKRVKHGCHYFRR